MRSHGLRALVLGLLFAVHPGSAWAGDLTVEQYCELTLARLRLAHSSWVQKGRAPRPSQESALWRRHGITAEAYLRFGSEHASAVGQYLDLHPDIKRQIEQYRQDIGRAIARREPRQ